MLSVNNIEVIYDHVILVLKGVSLDVPEGHIVVILGANGAGKTTTLKAISNLLQAERGEVTKGSIQFDDFEVHDLSPNELVTRGCIQVMEGRHVFETPDCRRKPTYRSLYQKGRTFWKSQRNWKKTYSYFPRLKERRTSQAGYTSGGEQQMLALGRALMSKPKMILLDEPSMGLAPQLVKKFLKLSKTSISVKASVFCWLNKIQILLCVMPIMATYWKMDES